MILKAITQTRSILWNHISTLAFQTLCNDWRRRLMLSMNHSVFALFFFHLQEVTSRRRWSHAHGATVLPFDDWTQVSWPSALTETHVTLLTIWHSYSCFMRQREGVETRTIRHNNVHSASSSSSSSLWVKRPCGPPSGASGSRRTSQCTNAWRAEKARG